MIYNNNKKKKCFHNEKVDAFLPFYNNNKVIIHIYKPLLKISKSKQKHIYIYITGSAAFDNVYVT